jgi:hypothetical protein
LSEWTRRLNEHVWKTWTKADILELVAAMFAEFPKIPEGTKKHHSLVAKETKEEYEQWKHETMMWAFKAQEVLERWRPKNV